MNIFRDADFDFIGKRNIALAISLTLILAGLISIFFHNGLKYGIDFSGGTLIQVKFNEPTTAEDLRKALPGDELGSFTIQQIGATQENEFLIRLSLAVEKDVEHSPTTIVFSSLEKTYGAGSFENRRTESVGPTIGEELKKSATGAITGAVALMLIYISVRFRFTYAIGAILALVHDVLITVGAFSIANREFNLPVVAALLTIVGYSINDTIVVFDRIRENRRIMHKDSLERIINVSINQTLSRTILTSGTTLFTVISLFLFGGEVINDFAFALLIGITVGTYSSIYIASPVLIWWKALQNIQKKTPAKQQSA